MIELIEKSIGDLKHSFEEILEKLQKDSIILVEELG
jgi:hypothetical protein